MGVAASLVGRSVPGRRLPGLWHVLECISTPNDPDRPSRSHGYKARHDNGREAFLKAIDADLASDPDEMLSVRLQAALMHHTFEAKVSERCRGNRMDRVCLTIDHGEQMIEHNGYKEPVFYLLFDLAEGDIRQEILVDKLWSVSDKMTLIHSVAVGMQQLHSASVSHNDLKPPNVLRFSDGHRVADLGQATIDDIQAPHDWNAIVGDPRYASPEILYAADGEPGSRVLSNEMRRISDLYLLGSFIHYMLTCRMLTPAVIDRLHPSHKPMIVGGWAGNYPDVLPYWRSAFGEQMDSFLMGLVRIPELKLHAEPLTDMVIQLCEPDPKFRGFAHKGASRRDVSLQQCVSYFDRLAKLI